MCVCVYASVLFAMFWQKRKYENATNTQPNQRSAGSINSNKTQKRKAQRREKKASIIVN